MKVLIRAWGAESLSQMEVWNSAIALGRREFLCLSLWTVCPCVCTAGPVAGGESGQGSPEQTAVWVTHSIKHRGSDATPRHALTALCLSFKCCACGGGIRSLFFFLWGRTGSERASFNTERFVWWRGLCLTHTLEIWLPNVNHPLGALTHQTRPFHRLAVNSEGSCSELTEDFFCRHNFPRARVWLVFTVSRVKLQFIKKNMFVWVLVQLMSKSSTLIWLIPMFIVSF